MLKNDDSQIILIIENLNLVTDNLKRQLGNVAILTLSCSSINKIISEFLVLLSKTVIQTISKSQKDRLFLTSFLPTIKNFNDFLKNLSPVSYLNCIKTNSITNILNTINSFCNQFNKFIMHFHISEFPPFLHNQLIIQDLYDLNEILSNQNNNILNETEKSANIKEISTIVNSFLEKEKEEKDKEIRNKKILTQIEIADSLSQYFLWFVKSSDFLFQNKIGYGSYSTVFSGKQISTNKIVSIKKIHSNQISQQIFDSFKHEIEIISSLHHRSIISFQGVCSSPSLLIVTEYMSHGNLYNWLRTSPNRSNPTKLTIIALGIAYGLSYLHSKHIIHHDIKSSNILLDENDYPKICDFGVSEYMKSINAAIQNDDFINFDISNTLNSNNTTSANDVGTIRWMAPEILSHQSYNEKSDVYSYGILLWEMITKTIPFRKLNDYQIVNQVIYEDLRPPIPNDISPSLRNLLEKCLSKDPSNRPSFENIVQLFETGEIEFTGSDRRSIEVYINKSTKAYNDLSQEMILNDLKTNPVLGLHKLKVVLTNNSYFFKKELVDELLQITKNCKSNEISNESIQVFSVLFNNQNTIEYFSNHGGVESFYKMIVSYSTTSMNHVIDVCQKLFETSHLMLNTKQLEKIASFIADGEIDAINFFKKIIALNQNMPEIISILIQTSTNFIHSGKQNSTNVLILVIDLFDILSEQLIKNNQLDQLTLIFNFIVSLIDNSYLKLNDVIRVILKILEFTPPSNSFVSLFISSLFSRFVSSKEEIEALSILLLVIKKKIRFNILDIQLPFCECLKSSSDKILIGSLKVLYAYFNFNRNKRSLFSEFELSGLLLNENMNVASLAAANILNVITDSSQNFDLESNISTILKYLNNHLNPRNVNYSKNCSLIALKLCGFLTSDLNLIMLLDENHIFDLIGLYLDDSTDFSSEKHQEISLNIFSNVAYTYPILRSLLNHIETIIAILRQKDYLQEVILSFLSNISICPDAAKIIANYLIDISLILKENSIENQYRIVGCLSHISQNAFLAQMFDDSCIQNIVEFTKDKWDVPNFDILFDLYHFISSLENGKQVLKKYDFDKFAQSNLNTSNQQLKLKIIRIVFNLKSA